MGAGPVGKVYVVTEGTLVIIQADGGRHVLEVGDSVFILPNEARAVANESKTPADDDRHNPHSLIVTTLDVS